MAQELPPVRRIVTANRPDGTSYFAEDGPAPAVKTVAQRPGFRVTNLWRTIGAPTDVNALDESRKHEGIQPPKNGNIVRIIDFPPEPADAAERKRIFEATFRSLYPDATKHAPSEQQHPGMHTTITVDYAIVLEGELIAIMDHGETVMRAGDVLIQRATSHAWANRSGKMARILFVLIDGK
jgi:hypothetical protein